MTTAERKMKAKDLITEHARDYLTAKVKIPLGNPALKNVHTNQFLFMDFPSDFSLENWETIAKALNSSETRYGGYSKTRWYIEGCTIDVDAKGKAEMSLDLNAFASTTKEFTDGYRALTKAYEDAVNNTVSSTKAKTTSSTKQTTNAVKSNNTTIKNGWWGKWVTEFVKKTVGNETDTLKKCKIMYETFRQKVFYAYYYDADKTYKGVNTYESAYKNGHLNCADGANILCAFYECCGASSSIYLGKAKGDGHYVVKCTINGKSYWTDQSGARGAHNTLRGWNQTYGGLRGGTNKGKRIAYA